MPPRDIEPTLSPENRQGIRPRPAAVAGRLALADGSVFHGTAFGATGKQITSIAEVVFNTAMCGYQESLTDPSYTGQILVQTFPLIGNTGVNDEDVESRKVQVAGLVVRELARRHSNFRARGSLGDYLAAAGMLGMSGIDTRALTMRLRSGGSMSGVLTDRADLTDDQLVEMARNAPSMAGQNLVPRVGCNSGSTWRETLGEWTTEASEEVRAGAGHQHLGSRSEPTPRPPPSGRGSKALRVLTLDCGAKANILRNLADRGCEVKVVPHTTTAESIIGMFENKEIDGLFISNGPGDPAAVEQTIATLRGVMQKPGTPIPTFGICLGHQLLALAAGAKTFKLKFGHRGANQPVFNEDTGRVEITSQNHGFAVDPKSLELAGGRATHVHLNDGTLAGFAMKGKPVFAVQYHPEASPGPHDAGYLFDQFVGAMRGGRERGGRGGGGEENPRRNSEKM